MSTFPIGTRVETKHDGRDGLMTGRVTKHLPAPGHIVVRWDNGKEGCGWLPSDLRKI